MSESFGLHRNVHPNHLYEGQVTMEAFSASSGENYQLSVDCEKVWLGRVSYEFRTSSLGRASLGVWTIPREQFARLKLEVRADQIPQNPAHSLIIFPVNDRAKRRDAARRLAAFANESAISRL